MIDKAQPPLEFIPPAFNPFVLRGCQFLLSPWLKSQTNLTEINGSGIATIVDLYEKFHSGKIRFLLAFRHPSINDPLVMAYLLWKLSPKTAKELGINLQAPIHAHFLYDRGIPLWAGNKVGWLYSRLGGTPIMRGKLDLVGLRSARDLFVNGNLPLAAAPEGATNGHNEIVSPAEPGIAQLSFWCVEDLLKAKRVEEVFVLPIGIQYYYLTPPWQELEELLRQLERDCGLDIVKEGDENNREFLYRRLYGLGEHVLGLMENFYRQFYHQDLPKIESNEDANRVLSLRLQNLLDVALKVAEEYFNMTAKGSFIDRCRRLEQAGWERIYREELKPDKNISLLEKGLADRVAEEADLRIWHMRLVESFVAVTGYYVKEKPTAERFAETLLLLWDVITKIEGGNPFFRPQIGKQKVQITVSEPISISQRWEQYQSNRRQAVATLTQDLQTVLEGIVNKAIET